MLSPQAKAGSISGPPNDYETETIDYNVYSTLCASSTVATSLCRKFNTRTWFGWSLHFQCMSIISSLAGPFTPSVCLLYLVWLVPSFLVYVYFSSLAGPFTLSVCLLYLVWLISSLQVYVHYIQFGWPLHTYCMSIIFRLAGPFTPSACSLCLIWLVNSCLAYVYYIQFGWSLHSKCMSIISSLAVPSIILYVQYFQFGWSLHAQCMFIISSLAGPFTPSVCLLYLVQLVHSYLVFNFAGLCTLSVYLLYSST